MFVCPHHNQTLKAHSPPLDQTRQDSLPISTQPFAVCSTRSALLTFWRCCSIPGQEMCSRCRGAALTENPTATHQMALKAALSKGFGMCSTQMSRACSKGANCTRNECFPAAPPAMHLALKKPNSK